MNRNMMDLDELSSNEFNHSVGEQPRKLMSRKKKSENLFKI
jgi:hypothetical protein